MQEQDQNETPYDKVESRPGFPSPVVRHVTQEFGYGAGTNMGLINTSDLPGQFGQTVGGTPMRARPHPNQGHIPYPEYKTGK